MTLRQRILAGAILLPVFAATEAHAHLRLYFSTTGPLDTSNVLDGDYTNHAFNPPPATSLPDGAVDPLNAPLELLNEQNAVLKGDGILYLWAEWFRPADFIFAMGLNIRVAHGPADLSDAHLWNYVIPDDADTFRRWSPCCFEDGEPVEGGWEGLGGSAAGAFGPGDDYVHRVFDNQLIPNIGPRGRGTTLLAAIQSGDAHG